MASTIPKLRFVRCPTCLKVLAELPEITVYKCGGCGTTLRAKVHSIDGEILSAESAARSSRNLSDGGSPDNQKGNFEKQTSSSSGRHGDTDQALTESVKVFVSSGENGTKTRVSDYNGESLKEKDKSPVYERNGIRGLPLEKEDRIEPGIASKITNSLNQELKVSSDQEIPAASNSLNSNDKLEESPESLENDSSSKDDKINGGFRKDPGFLLRRNSRAHDGSSVSSIDEGRRKRIPQRHLDLSRRTFGKRTSSVISGRVSSRNGDQVRERDFSFVSGDFQSALNRMDSESEAPSISKSKEAKQFLKFRCSEKDDRVEIIRKVDELKSELLEYFHRKVVTKDCSRLAPTARFEGKFPTKNPKSPSLIPLSKQPHSSFLNPRHGGICCHNERCSPCPHSACYHLPESTTSRRPLHMKRCPSLHREPQNLQSNDKKPQAVKRHCRPVSGGAPFVICYRCYNLLQLPADFLLSTKRVHKLRCGSCYEVLRYSFRPRTRSMPWTPAEARHPPSEDKNDEALDNEIRVSVSNDLAGGDPVSYSEEYGMSFGKSCSFEAAPSRHLARYDGIVEEEQSGEEAFGSQLHKLMGYSSARYLLFENLSPSEGRRIGQDR